MTDETNSLECNVNEHVLIMYENKLSDYICKKCGRHFYVEECGKEEIDSFD